MQLFWGSVPYGCTCFAGHERRHHAWVDSHWVESRLLQAWSKSSWKKKQAQPVIPPNCAKNPALMHDYLGLSGIAFTWSCGLRIPIAQPYEYCVLLLEIIVVFTCLNPGAVSHAGPYGNDRRWSPLLALVRRSIIVFVFLHTVEHSDYS